MIFAGKALTLEPVPSDVAAAFAVQAERGYEGAERCRMCHRKEEQGAQYDLWKESKHAKAYETLASEPSKQIAAERGIENPQEAAECLRCHVTGHDADPALLGSKYDKAEGVGCEACHGPGSEYYKKSTMEAIMRGEIDPASVGLVVHPGEEACVQCHNEESPTYKGFDYEERSKEILHPIPEARKAEYP